MQSEPPLLSPGQVPGPASCLQAPRSPAIKVQVHPGQLGRRQCGNWTRQLCLPFGCETGRGLCFLSPRGEPGKVDDRLVAWFGRAHRSFGWTAAEMQACVLPTYMRGANSEPLLCEAFMRLFPPAPNRGLPRLGPPRPHGRAAGAVERAPAFEEALKGSR
ncbi:hypothetical protein P7K49_005939 [Saguinus oedipus]|uniref:Uncharacterized protein n=1 Tax=Saguinus oedipus TaxID=9490 RepID=A0ABQ9W3F3_SAGOE|nr:hypothetical protein P7K49_005939 [Saguinus oedipus]